ncbi:MAG: GNAT family N-acetyltransferase [Anaerolineae bacterium]|nr:GNAT family N-acetyltransferase [Anaerolineae bacterium]
MYTIRPFDFVSDADYEQVAALDLAVWPDDPSLASEWKKSDELRPKGIYYRRWLAENGNGHAVGQITVHEPWWSPEAGKFQLDLRVHPDCAGNGMYRDLYEWMVAAVSAEIELKKLISSTRENFTEYRTMLESVGFTVVMRYPRSQLDLTTFDPGQYDNVVQQVRAGNISIVTLPELQKRHEDWLIRLEDMSWEIEQDVPYHDEKVRTPLEQFAKMFEYENCAPESWHIAVDNATEHYVGVSNLWLSLGNPDKIYTGLTGVRRAYRRRGIATALKALSLAWAQQTGATKVETDNEENNPMYQLNMQLGFKPLPADLDYKLELNYENPTI